jgi:hypothetical protein
LREFHDGERAAYGKRILATLLQQLNAEFGDGFSYSSLTRMVGPITYSAAVSIISTATPFASRFLSSSPRIAQDLSFPWSCSSARRESVG